MNWFETEYPSPAFPTPGSDGRPRIGSTQYFTAYGAVTRGYPLLRGAQPASGETDPPEVLDLMHRVTLIPVVRRTLFGPRITGSPRTAAPVRAKAPAANLSGTSRSKHGASSRSFPASPYPPRSSPN